MRELYPFEVLVSVLETSALERRKWRSSKLYEFSNLKSDFLDHSLHFSFPLLLPLILGPKNPRFLTQIPSIHQSFGQDLLQKSEEGVKILLFYQLKFGFAKDSS